VLAPERAGVRQVPVDEPRNPRGARRSNPAERRPGHAPEEPLAAAS
jgi:hypothetical protein